jgi:hypothetical protein
MSAALPQQRTFVPESGRRPLAIDRGTYVRSHHLVPVCDARLTEPNLNQFRMIVTGTLGQLLRSRKQCNA